MKLYDLPIESLVHHTGFSTVAVDLHLPPPLPVVEHLLPILPDPN
jgi:hypothetical protein